MPLATKTLLNGCLVLALLNLGGTAFAGSSKPIYDWSGWYAGANLGSGFGADHIDIDPMSPGAVIRDDFVSPRLGDNPAGALGGLQGGVNWQSGTFVYGLEADLSLADISGHVVGPPLLSPYDFLTTDSQKLDRFGTLRARVGFEPWDRSLIFLTGGLALGHASVSTFAIDTSANLCGGAIKFCVAGNSQKWLPGFTLGAGWEYEIAPSWSVKLEYLYYDLGKITDSMVDILTPNPDLFQGAAVVKGDILRVGLEYHFR